MTVYCYYRVSTDEQNEENQAFGVKKYAAYKGYSNLKNVIEHAVSGKVDYKKRKLWRLMKKCQAGDVILVSELSRLSRSMLDMYEITKYLTDKKVIVYCVKENIELGTNALGMMIMTVFAFAAQIERERIAERTKESLARVKASGKHLGRPFGFSYCKLHKHKEKVIEMWKKDVPRVKIAKTFNCSSSTLYRYIDKLGLD